MPNPFNFYPACGMNAYQGYGRAEIGLIKGFAELGVELNLYPNANVPTLQLGNPRWSAYPHEQGQELWLYSMIESTRASKQWVDNINAYCKRLIVPSPDMPELFRASGVTVPIDFVPLGVDAFEPSYKRREFDKPFTFLSYSYGDMRKGAELAVMAFMMLYADNPDYKLIIKVRDNDDILWLQHIKNEQISVVGGELSEQANEELLHSAHCFVFPSRAEGFGLPPREATLSGLPSIATRWLGMWDVDNWGYGLGIEDMRLCQYMKEVNNAVGALWSEPSFDDVLKWMQWIPDNYEQAIGSNLKHRNYLLENFTWKQTAEKILALRG